MSGIQDSLSKLFRSAGIVFLSTISTQILALSAEIFIVRSLSPEEYGTIAVAYTTALIAGRLSLFGIPEGITRFISDTSAYREKTSITKQGFVMITPIAIITSSLFLIFPSQIGNLLNNNEVNDYLVFFSVYAFLFPISRIIISVLRARGETFHAVLSKDLFPRVGGLIFFFTILFLGVAEIGAVAYWVSLPLISFVIGLYFLSAALNLGEVAKASVEWSTIRSIWSFSWPLALSSSLIVVFSNIDVMMIEYFLTSESTGHYRSVQPLRQVTEFVLSSFIFLYLPLATEYFSQGENEKLIQLYKSTTKWATELTLPLILVFSVFSADLVRIFFGPEYLPASDALSVLVAGLFFNVLVGPNGATAKAINRPRVDMVSAAVGFVVNILLNLLLIPRSGILGAAIATVIGYVTYNMMEVFLIYVQIGKLPFSINQIKPIPLTVGCAVLVERSVGEIGIISIFLIGVLISAIHVVSIILTKSVDKNDTIVINSVEERIGRELPIVHDLIND
ncbi:flippase [Halogeometricum sp. S1BR25-6]|uniref:Flippase n=1 Tax=Halogeometricum salsisoli TaxID=2950536 RepID=A0ABU2GHD6_9EURY|nr:flippase [Halogeometricum sp. S1BR25-6]MDS0300240.1 flippase [Halogeometricum sp. S1BR25-6]